MNAQNSRILFICLIIILGTTQLTLGQADHSQINGLYQQALQIQNQDPEKAIGFMNQIIEIDSLVYGAYITIAGIKVSMGEDEEALKYIKEAVKKGFTNLNFIQNDPRFSSFRDDPEFRKIINGKDQQLIIEGAKNRLDFYESLLRKEGYHKSIDHDSKIGTIIHGSEKDFNTVLSKLLTYSESQVQHLFEEPLKEYVFITVADSLDWVSSLNRSPYSLGGFSSQSNSLMTYKIETVIHEFTHALHFNHQNLLGQAHPAWINEGIGTNFDAIEYNDNNIAIGVSNARLQYLKSLLERGDEISWNDLFRMNQQEFLQKAQAAYAQAGYIFRYLQSKGVLQDWYKDYINDYEVDPSGMKTLKKYLSEDLEKVEEEWKAWVLEQPAEPYVPMGFNIP